MAQTLSKSKSISLSRRGILQALCGTGILVAFHFVSGGGEITPGIVFYGFWLLPAVIASLHGTLDGAFAAILSGIVYLTIQALTAKGFLEPYKIIQYFTDPLIWLFSSIVLGEIRCQYSLTLEQLQDHLNTLSQSNDKLLQTLSDLRRTNASFSEELNIAHHKLEEIIFSLISLIHTKPTQILLNIDNVVQSILDPDKFSIYANGVGGLEVLASHGWQSEERFPLRVVPEDPLYECVVVQREALIITIAGHAKILQSHGEFVAPLFDPNNNEVFGMFKIEALGREFTANTITLAKSLCQFIGHVYALAKDYQDSFKMSIYAKQGRIFSDALYQILYPYMLAIAQQAGFPFSSLHFVLRSTSDNVFSNELRSLAETLKKHLPTHALIFQGKGSSNELRVLLTGYTPRKMEMLETQIAKMLQEPTSFFANKVYLTRKMEYFPSETAWV